MLATRHGYPLGTCEAAKAEGVLREPVRARGTVTSGEPRDSVRSLCMFPRCMFPRSRALLGMLYDACSGEDAARGVMLASLVVGKATGMPGEGCFVFAEIERIYAAYDGEGIRT